MKLTTTVSFDLHGAEPEKYDEFYTELRKEKWEGPQKGADSTVVARFEDGIDYDDVISTVKSDFAKAAEKVGVKYTGKISVGYPIVELL